MNTTELSHAEWRTSSRSGGNGACVEVALNLPGVVAVRDSKNPHGGVLSLTPEAFAALTASIRTGFLHLS